MSIKGSLVPHDPCAASTMVASSSLEGHAIVEFVYLGSCMIATVTTGVLFHLLSTILCMPHCLCSTGCAALGCPFDVPTEVQ